MKKNLSFLLTLAFVLVMLPVVVFAAATKPTAEDLKTPPVISDLAINSADNNAVRIAIRVRTPADTLNAVEYFEEKEQAAQQDGYISNIELQYSVNAGAWIDAGLDFSTSNAKSAVNSEGEHWYGIFETAPVADLKTSDYVRVHARYVGADAKGNAIYSDWSNELAVNEKAAFTASSWAQSELFEAKNANLIPSELADKDLAAPITRAEFAAVMINGYKALSDKDAEKISANPFKDTDDSAVLKAYNLGIVNGTSADTFTPNAALNREQAAVMLTRLYKAAKFDGWTPATDADFSAAFADTYIMPETYYDDADISEWAKESVYFLKANEIMSGTATNKFAPKAVTAEEIAANYGGVTREQALIITKRMVQKLK